MRPSEWKYDKNVILENNKTKQNLFQRETKVNAKLQLLILDSYQSHQYVSHFISFV